MTRRQVFAIDIDAVARFGVGRAVCDQDRHGEAIEGRVVELKPGNEVALVIVETEGAS
jgi:hypothetical protein